jgi:hypothetical protein
VICYWWCVRERWKDGYNDEGDIAGEAKYLAAGCDEVSLSVSDSMSSGFAESEAGLVEQEKMQTVSRPRSLSAKWTFLWVEGVEWEWARCCM